MNILVRQFVTEHQSGQEITLPAEVSDDSETDDASLNNEDIRNFLNYRKQNIDISLLGHSINDTRFVLCVVRAGQHFTFAVANVFEFLSYLITAH